MTKTEYERTLNAALFFAAHTKHCVAKKLFKLLYLLDVTQFRQNGRTVTGLRYAAYTPGPVPPGLAHSLEHVSGDLAAFVRSMPIRADGKQRQVVLPADGASFNEGPFTEGHLNIMRALVSEFSDADVSAIDVSPRDGGAWQAAFSRGREEDIHMEDSLVPTDPYRGAKLAAADQHRRSTRSQRAFL